MNFINKFFEKPEPEWDDGSGEPVKDKRDGAFVFADAVMMVYGAVAGFIGWQIVEYLHQRFACAAWGVPFTSRHIRGYSVPQLIMDCVSFVLVYAFVCAIGVFVDWIVRYVINREAKDSKEIVSSALMKGFLVMILVSILMFIVPFNIFMIGV